MDPETGTADAISAYDSADSPAARPASRNETITAGPASGTASCITKNTPVPTVAPTPNIMSVNVPSDRSRPSLDVPVRDVIGFLRQICDLRDACGTVMGGLSGRAHVLGASPWVTATVGAGRVRGQTVDTAWLPPGFAHSNAPVCRYCPAHDHITRHRGGHPISTVDPTYGLVGGLIGYLLYAFALVGVFRKADEPVWQAFIPIWNSIVLIKISGQPIWWIILLLIPIVNLVVAILILHGLSTSFGHGAGFTVGLFFLSLIFLFILGYDSTTYQGATGGEPIRGYATA